jgi:hypothetical protein
MILSLIVLMAGRTSDKILKGLQGTAAVTIISRAVHEAYKD